MNAHSSTPLVSAVLLATLALCAALAAGASSQEGGPSIDKSVRYRISAANSRSWLAAYDLRVSSELVLVRVAVNLLPGDDVSRARVDGLEPEWKRLAESIWSGRYALKIGDEVTLPIRVDVSFRGPDFHHAVIVRNGIARADQLHWGTRSTGQTVAHEIGHMLGAFDEYASGGTNPAGAVIDAASIMTSRPANGKTSARHYDSIRSQVISELEREDVSIVELLR